MIKTIHHPAECITQEQAELIRLHTAQAEKSGLLQKEQIDLAIQQGWFSMLAPMVYGGQQKPLPEVVRLEEAIAWADGSMGWVVTLCAGAGWFGGFLDPGFAEKIFSVKEVCLAGSGAATGTASVREDGYLINGKWWHASGAPHNTVFTANCRLEKNGVPLMDESGEPVIKAFAFLRHEVTIVPAWNSFGLVATASHAFEVKNLVAGPERVFVLSEEEVVVSSPLYRYPFQQLAEVTLAANIMGMVLHFLDEAGTLLLQKREKEQRVLEPLLQQGQYDAAQLREGFYAALDTSWQEQLHIGKVPEPVLNQVSIAARILAGQGIALVDKIYPYCGLAAADKNSLINRVWRDIHTASQHSLLVYPR